LLEEAVAGVDAIIAAGMTLVWRLVKKPGFIQLDDERFA